MSNDILSNFRLSVPNVVSRAKFMRFSKTKTHTERMKGQKRITER